jgi:hypothetical protein
MIKNNEMRVKCTTEGVNRDVNRKIVKILGNHVWGILRVTGDNIKTDLKEDVRVELESCTDCSFYRVPERGSFIAQTACIPADMPRKLVNRIEGTPSS